MERSVQQTCQFCGFDACFTMADDGFFYCGICSSQADDIVDTGVDEENLFTHYSTSCTRTRTARTSLIAAEPIFQVKLSMSQYMDHPDGMVDAALDGVGPAEPSDFGTSKKSFSYEEYCAEVKTRYVTGIQVMIQLQCKALVEEFNVSPLIVGLIGPVWLRYLASTRIMDDEWADRTVNDSEAQVQGEVEEFQPSAQYGEPVNIHGKRVVYVWFSSLRSTIPISSALAICFLLCHVAREAITPPDMLKWALEGKLPYFSAFRDIEKELGPPSEACPIRTSRMFRPIQLISSQKLESDAAKIGNKIGLELPQVNFHAVASRFLGSLSLPTEEILLMACRVFEWSLPPELYISANEFRIPTRACVMSILIVAMRIIFDINGYGVWESSLCSDSSCDLEASGGDKSDTELSDAKLLGILEAEYDKLDDVYAYFGDLQSYLQYCKDVVFSGLKPSYEDLEEEKLLKECWDFYLDNNKDATKSDNPEGDSSGSSGPERNRPNVVKKKKRDKNTSSNSKDEAIRRLKMDMDNNKFCYIPPRVNVKRKEYLHYARRRKDVYVYAVHADYYILLRSCAKVARVETRVMHIAVLSLERRLQLLEKRVDSLLRLKLNFSDDCDFCKDA